MTQSRNSSHRGQGGHSHLREYLLVALLSLSAGLFTIWYCSSFYRPDNAPFNPYLAPAIPFAFGEGLKDPNVAEGTKLQGFIAHCQPESLSYNDVPHPMPGGPITGFQRGYLYFIILVGWCWRIFGVSWGSIGVIVGVFSVVSFVATYALIRLRARPTVAALGAAAFFLCPAHLALLGAPRDYAKTPLFLIVFLLLGILLTRRLQARGLLLMGALLGAVLGIGYGIRQDVFVVWAVIPPVLMFFLPGGVAKKPLARLGSLCLAVLVFTVFAFPMLHARSKDSDSTSHHIVGGLFRYNEETLGVGGAPYLWINEGVMTDSFINTLHQDYYRYSVGERAQVDYLSVAYGRVGFSYLKNLFIHFPADFLTRWYAASRTILSDGPWLVNGKRLTVYDVRNFLVDGVQNVTSRVRSFWNAWGLEIVLLSILVTSAWGVRLPLALLGLVVFFTGYPSLQFQPRHFGHLGVVAVVVAALLVEGSLQVLGRIVRRRRCCEDVEVTDYATLSWRKALGKMATFAVTGVVVFLVPLWGLRWYQDREMRLIVERYKNVPLIAAESASVERRADGTRRIRVVLASRRNSGGSRVRYDTEYLALRISTSGELPENVRVVDGNVDGFSVRALAGEKAHGPATLFFPVVRNVDEYTVEVQGGDPATELTFFSVADPDQLPMWMTFILPDDYSSLQMHKILVTPAHAAS